MEVYMLSDRECLIYLYERELITRAKIRKLLIFFKGAFYQEIFRHDFNAFLSKSQLKSIRDALSNEKECEAFQKEARDYKTWTVLDADYPVILRNITDYPVVFYTLGDIKLLRYPKAISVIGSRIHSNRAKVKLYYLLKPLIKQDFVFISGLAKGIDGACHKLADCYGGKTIAVVAAGFNHVYPKEHAGLFRDLSERHLILSEYPVNKKPERYHFPERNRLIAALGFGTLIVEARLKSGTMITADQALDMGRVVMAVPGEILCENSLGCHMLIQNGAKLVQNTHDIEEEWAEIKWNWTEFYDKTQ